jgi:probable rRNA maturation factor
LPFRTVHLITVTITNRQKALRIDRKRLRGAIQAIVRDAAIGNARISVAVVDDAAIAKLHDEFLNDPAPTDVLSFLLERSPQMLEGEVVVSTDTARTVAPRYGSSAEDELLLYVIHGTLHLVGYDDATPRKRAVMQKEEQKYLSLSRTHTKNTLKGVTTETQRTRREKHETERRRTQRNGI